jgi:hypothetical protein
VRCPLLLLLLHPVLQLTAVSALSTLIDDWNFSDTQFVEFVGPAMQLLVALLGQAAQLDSQTQVRAARAPA